MKLGPRNMLNCSLKRQSIASAFCVTIIRVTMNK